MQGIDGSGVQGIDGSGVQGIDGSGVQGIDGSGVQGIDGSGVQGIDGSGVQGIDGSGVQGIDGSGVQGIDGSGVQGIDGSGVQGIDGSGVQGIDGSGVQGIDGSGVQGIDGSGVQGIDGSGAQGIDGSGVKVQSIAPRAELLVFAQVSSIDSNAQSITLLGREVSLAGIGTRDRISTGDFVAIYGTRNGTEAIFSAARRVGGYELSGVADSFVSGMVDSIDYATGRATIDGFAVDYTSLLAARAAPRLGDFFAVHGKAYATIGLVAAGSLAPKAAVR